MIFMEFPKNFLWGAASAAGQTEGHPLELGGGLSVWDAFCARPGSIQNGETDEVCTDFLHRFREDVGLLASLGLRAYRFSVSWARVDPRGTGEWSEEALRYYDELVDCCLAHGVEPFVTLHHWELPLALETRGGWLSRETPEAFARFAGMLAARLRGRVQHYFTLNEPECILGLGCETGAHAPGLRLGTEELFACWKNLLLAHSLGLRAVRSADPGALVGLATTGRICYPERPEDEAAARAESFRLSDGDWIFTHSQFLDPACLGAFPAPEDSQLGRLWAATPEAERAELHARPDFLGVNLYNGLCVRGENGRVVYTPRCPGFPRTAYDWPVTEQALYWAPVFLAERYGLPLYISENGLSCNDKIYRDGQVHDADRIDFLARYLTQLRAAAPKADVRGYFHWSLTDNFEWNRGFSQRFGLIYIDYPTQRRILKDSARWYAAVAASNGASLDE